MPKVAIAKDRNALATKHDVRLADYRAVVLPES